MANDSRCGRQAVLLSTAHPEVVRDFRGTSLEAPPTAESSACPPQPSAIAGELRFSAIDSPNIYLQGITPLSSLSYLRHETYSCTRGTSLPRHGLLPSSWLPTQDNVERSHRETNPACGLLHAAHGITDFEY